MTEYEVHSNLGRRFFIVRDEAISYLKQLEREGYLVNLVTREYYDNEYV